MDKSVSVYKISGVVSDSGWSQVYEFEDIERSGPEKLVVILSCDNNASENQVENVKLGREVATKIKNDYQLETEPSAFEALKKVQKNIFSETKDKFGKNLELITCVLRGNILYVSMSGGGCVYSFQDNKLSRIILKEGGDDDISVSGKVQDNLIFVGTREFSEKMANNGLQSLLVNSSVSSPDEIVDILTSEIRGGSVFSKVASAIYVKEKTADKSFDIGKIEENKEKEESIRKMLSDSNKEVKKKENPFSFTKKLFVKNELNAGLLLPREKGKKAPLFVGLVLLLGLIVSIFYGVNKKEERDFKATYTSILEEALHNVNEAKDIYRLDRNRSRELFADALRKLEDLKGKDVPGEELSPLTAAIELGRNQILGEYAASTNLFMDTSLLSQDFEAQKIVLDNDQIYLSDLEGKILQVDIENKRSSVVLGAGTLPKIIDFSAYGGRVYVLTEKGIYNAGNGDSDKVTDEGDSDFRLSAYESNLYVADKAVSKIWKYVGGENSGFSAPVLWTDADEVVDFSSLVDWKIDGTIWILKDGNEIIQLSQGSEVDFEVKNVVPEISEASAFWTDKSSKSLYVTDPKDKRMVIIDKESGDYIAQYSLDGVDNPKSVVVSEDLKKAIILSNGKLYSVNLRHLE